MTLENIISLSSLLVSLILVVINQVNNKKIRTKQDIVNSTLLDQWKIEKESTDKEQWKQIEHLTELFGKLDYSYKEELEKAKYRIASIEIKMENQDKLINSIYQTLKDLPKAISDQITKEINSLKELFEEKIENLKPKSRVSK